MLLTDIEEYLSFLPQIGRFLLSDHLPPNKPNFHLISDHLLHFQISDIRPEDYLNTLKYLISDLKSSTSKNI